jgi:hypothetical protein
LSFTKIRDQEPNTTICCGHLSYFVAIWYIFPVLVCCTRGGSGLIFVGLGRARASYFRLGFLRARKYCKKGQA